MCVLVEGEENDGGTVCGFWCCWREGKRTLVVWLWKGREKDTVHFCVGGEGNGGNGTGVFGLA